jgi:quercetin dioxygenase-like cupin family protein
MRLIRDNEVRKKTVVDDGKGNRAKDACIQVLVPEGPNFVMRVFTVKPGGHTPRHSHPFEHEVFVLSGKGRAVGKETFEMSPGDAIYVPPDDPHCFENAGLEDLRIICVVPRSAA